MQQQAGPPAAATVIVQAPPPAPAFGQPTVIQVPGTAFPQAVPQAMASVSYGPAPTQGRNVDFGPTAFEAMAYNMEFARVNGVNQPQEFKPSDDNPRRMYWLRELDNQFTLRDRQTIDRLRCRWYMMDDGTFYAVRLP